MVKLTGPRKNGCLFLHPVFSSFYHGQGLQPKLQQLLTHGIRNRN